MPNGHILSPTSPVHLAPTVALQARVAHIVTGLGTYFGCLAYDRLTGTEDNTETVRRRAQQLRETLTDLGPSFIKAGQVLANRPDIVREDYMNELCILQVRFYILSWFVTAVGDPGTVCACASLVVQKQVMG
jgi:predicted unusual protein kinase regulating ubiquinone biosynthesis (AarF/ABC1/UbiB family)